LEDGVVVEAEGGVALLVGGDEEDVGRAGHWGRVAEFFGEGEGEIRMTKFE
jgi:hypothetical protein